jgi:serine/threonine protein kinase
MERCHQCGSEVERAAAFCSQCGSQLRQSSAGSSRADALTMEAAVAADAPTYPSLRKPSSSQPASQASRDGGRFAPGTLVAERYRILSMLGRGGMGEVFRAHDLTLGQPVALKFLPESMIDKSMLERFHNEVRIARRISHPNVCRVYDIGETDNQVFLSMEYVDGEDLSSLLRRIGRLPVDQALAIARKICAGLAAAHDKGVLHRDLKPSNIMIDARGEVLIMDFGLAGLAHEIEDVRSGTPAYMAPEQLVGKEVTARSDIYALGLVFCELFTGKPAFEGNTRDEIMRVRRESTPHRLSTLVRDLGPAVEMVILRCLEEEPENRPSSALIVSAALPGGEYLIAIYRPDNYDPAVETEAMHHEIDLLNDEMVAAGARIFVGGLSSAGSARSLRAQSDGTLLVSDGPYTETKEHVVGFWVVKAADLNEALAWGRKAAVACRASVEVRPFYYSVEVQPFTGGRSKESNGTVWPPTTTEHTPLEPEQNSPTEGE